MENVKTYGENDQYITKNQDFLENFIAQRKTQIQILFHEFDKENKGYISTADLIPQLQHKFGFESNYLQQQLSVLYGNQKPPERMDLSEFTRVLTQKSSQSSIISRALQGELAIPNFQEFCQELIRIFDQVKVECEELHAKAVLPDYIPELVKVDPNLFAFSICTVDGQVFSHGDWDAEFTLQASILPITYCVALEQHGVQHVHEFIGREPSGAPYNAFLLNTEKKPHNPFSTAGGLIACSLIEPENNPSERFTNVFDTVSQLSGNSKISFVQQVYLSEKAHADHNRALSYFMRGNGVKGLEGTKITDTLDFYFQCCSIGCNTRDLAVIASTFANGGKCPLTGKRVFSTENVRNCLSILYSCGMSDFTGEYSFQVLGCPSKSGISGNLMVIIPKVMGLAIYSPKVDHRANSVRAIEFCRRFGKFTHYHMFEQLISKGDPITISNSK